MIKEYETDGIIIYWNPDICQHAGECTKNLKEVFDPDRRPWVITDYATDEKIMETIDKCPSGALSYKRK